MTTVLGETKLGCYIVTFGGSTNSLLAASLGVFTSVGLRSPLFWFTALRHLVANRLSTFRRNLTPSPSGVKVHIPEEQNPQATRFLTCHVACRIPLQHKARDTLQVILLTVKPATWQFKLKTLRVLWDVYLCVGFVVLVWFSHDTKS
jgi:hypothetical protein